MLVAAVVALRGLPRRVRVGSADCVLGVCRLCEGQQSSCECYQAAGLKHCLLLLGLGCQQVNTVDGRATRTMSAAVSGVIYMDHHYHWGHS